MYWIQYLGSILVISLYSPRLLLYRYSRYFILVTEYFIQWDTILGQQSNGQAENGTPSPQTGSGHSLKQPPTVASSSSPPPLPTPQPRSQVHWIPSPPLQAFLLHITHTAQAQPHHNGSSHLLLHHISTTNTIHIILSFILHRISLLPHQSFLFSFTQDIVLISFIIFFFFISSSII